MRLLSPFQLHARATLDYSDGDLTRSTLYPYLTVNGGANFVLLNALNQAENNKLVTHESSSKVPLPQGNEGMTTRMCACPILNQLC